MAELKVEMVYNADQTAAFYGFLPKKISAAEKRRHWTPEVEDYAKIINLVLENVLANRASICQPADIAWMKPLKDIECKENGYIR
ncbi:hypothetical protein PHMEG_00030282 [Phytophthora megakarya]|uniref:Uncharacterized protein n=1 Tax=Phytophthora megakarya TaxID=4795 RepID=A0A225V0N8_9STRA|nr:hypothetical protein PHMEG_00030282 [Phytophthora megakarya]